MRKKGFTLIELLAVIVILAIIALIATPIITNIISDAKKQSNERSLELYASAIENAIETYKLNNPTKRVTTGILTSSNDGKTLTKGEETLTIDYNGNVYCERIKMSADGNVYLSDCTVNGNKVDYKYGTNIPISFAEDSWEEIAETVKTGDLSAYKVGDTKEVALTGYTNGEANSNGLYTVRIANTSTPEECNQEGFSQSACGFVIEFVDIITEHRMNPTNTNVGGWPASEMYKFLNDTTDETIISIYERLPEDLQKVIKPTQVVSSHGKSDSSNFTSTDKLYLLSTKEVYGETTYRAEGDTMQTQNLDTAASQTRQLDYYEYFNTFNTIKGYNHWRLRTAHPRSDYFSVIEANGKYSNCDSSNNRGVAPAFKIG